ncbi:MAG: hypothetical protein JWP12_2135 [Bacteroidetes bacterium]|nr:hypothetical protein [Bacteroidota bacterium]
MKKLSAFILIAFLFGCNAAPRNPVVTEQQPVTKLNETLSVQLNAILKSDQEYRQGSMDDASQMGKNDYFNLIKVEAILDKYGWLGVDEVGEEGNTALFLVIQHADLRTQEKYLPMMTQAVMNHKAKGAQWALLEDRVTLVQTGRQIYGSQVIKDETTGLNRIAPIQNEATVNKRRAQVGLESLEIYAKKFGIDYKRPVE